MVTVEFTAFMSKDSYDGFILVNFRREGDVNSHPCLEDVTTHRQTEGGCGGESAAKGIPGG